jgi:hypothetical protein
MTIIKPELRCEMAMTDWRRTLMTQIRSRGFASATAYAESRPLLSLNNLVEDLGLPPAAAYGLERDLIDEAEQNGRMDQCARSLFVRDLRVELPDGWPAPSDGDPTRLIQRAKAFASLAFALPQVYAPALHRVRNAMERADIPGGWLPTGPEDPVLMEAFTSHWDLFRGASQPI